MNHTSRPFICLDEVVIDTVTGLMWTRLTNISNFTVARDGAINILKKEHFGHNDWRMPIDSEFEVLVKNIGGDALADFKAKGFYIYYNKQKGTSEYWREEIPSFVTINGETRENRRFLWPVRYVTPKEMDELNLSSKL